MTKTIIKKIYRLLYNPPSVTFLENPTMLPHGWLFAWESSKTREVLLHSARTPTPPRFYPTHLPKASCSSQRRPRRGFPTVFSLGVLFPSECPPFSVNVATERLVLHLPFQTPSQSHRVTNTPHNTQDVTTAAFPFPV